MRKTVGLALFVICGSTAFAQVGYRPITLGLKAGVPVTDAFHPGSASFGFDTKRYTVGPTVEFNIPIGLAVEADALYERLSFDSNNISLPSGFFSRTTANSWEFPLLLKIRPGVTRHVKPYVAPGVNFRYLTSVDQVSHFFTGNTVTTSRPGLLQNRFTAGFVIGAGLEMRSSALRLSPEFRYTRWGWESFRDPSGLFPSNDNQVEFLAGITF